MNEEQLQSLRERILADIVPLVLDSSTNGLERFTLLLRIIQAGNASPDIYSKAYESAKAIDDKDEQLSSLLSLLDEVNFEFDQKTVIDQQPSPQEAVQPESQPVAHTDQQ